MKEIAKLTQSEFDRVVAELGQPLLVDFYAAWCGPCKMIASLLEQLALPFAGRLRFFKVNVDEAPGLADNFGITGVRSLLLFHQGEECDRVVGFPSPPELVERLERLAARRSAAPMHEVRS